MLFQSRSHSQPELLNNLNHYLESNFPQQSLLIEQTINTPTLIQQCNMQVSQLIIYSQSSNFILNPTPSLACFKSKLQNQIISKNLNTYHQQYEIISLVSNDNSKASNNRFLKSRYTKGAQTERKINSKLPSISSSQTKQSLIKKGYLTTTNSEQSTTRSSFSKIVKGKVEKQVSQRLATVQSNPNPKSVIISQHMKTQISKKLNDTAKLEDKSVSISQHSIKQANLVEQIKNINKNSTQSLHQIIEHFQPEIVTPSALQILDQEPVTLNSKSCNSPTITINVINKDEHYLNIETSKDGQSQRLKMRRKSRLVQGTFFLEESLQEAEIVSRIENIVDETKNNWILCNSENLINPNQKKLKKSQFKDQQKKREVYNQLMKYKRKSQFFAKQNQGKTVIWKILQGLEGERNGQRLKGSKEDKKIKQSKNVDFRFLIYLD